MTAAVTRAISFKTIPEMRPRRGDPSTERCDAKGFLIDDRGVRRMELAQVDWVCFAPSSAMGPTGTWERVEHIQPDPSILQADPMNRKGQFMKARWDSIKPAYEAWKLGQEVPTTGTPLGAWPGLSPEQADGFRKLGYRTVEEVRDLTDGQADRIPMPNIRALRRQAASFIENLGVAVAAERDRAKDEQMASMAQQMAEMREEMARMQAKANAPAVAPEHASEIDALRAELDKRGIEYDGRWAAPKLRALLRDTAEAA